MGYRDQNGNDWADIIDCLTMHPETRQKVVRLLGEIDATSWEQSTSPVTVESPLGLFRDRIAGVQLGRLIETAAEKVVVLSAASA